MLQGEMVPPRRFVFTVVTKSTVGVFSQAMNFLQKSVAAWFQSYNFIKGPLQKLINNGLGAVQRGRDSINREHILS